MNDTIGKKLSKIRLDYVYPYIKGRLLDIGCGNNALVGRYKNGIGIDTYDWGGADILVKDSSCLEFNNREFDTITIIAALNHIPNRKEVLLECNRLLADDGRLIITMISPMIGFIWHKLRYPWDADQRIRKMKTDEAYGLSKRYILALADSQGFVLETNKRFMLGLNTMYIFRKKLYLKGPKIVKIVKSSRRMG